MKLLRFFIVLLLGYGALASAMEDPFKGFEERIKNACIACKSERESVRRRFAGNRTNKNIVDKYKESDEQQSTQEKIAARLAQCDAMRAVTPNQISLRITNNTCTSYDYRSYECCNNTNVSEAVIPFEEIKPQETVTLDALKLGEMGRLFSICSTLKAKAQRARWIILVLEKVHSGFVADGTIIDRFQTFPVQFNQTDSYRFNLELDGDCLNDSKLSFEVCKK